MGNIFENSKTASYLVQPVYSKELWVILLYKQRSMGNNFEYVKVSLKLQPVIK